MNQRRRFLGQTMMGAALAGSPMYLAIREAVADTRNRRAPGIQSSTGEVIVNGESAKPEQWPDRPGDVLVETQDTEATTILVGEDAFMVRANSKVIIEQDANFVVRGFQILTGKLLSVFGRKKQPVNASSIVATIGIRGTGLYVEAYPHMTYICTCYGEVSIQSKPRPEISEIVKTRHHESPRYVLDESRGGLIVPAPVFNHTDAELILLESLAGRPSPFPEDGPKYY